MGTKHLEGYKEKTLGHLANAKVCIPPQHYWTLLSDFCPFSSYLGAPVPSLVVPSEQYTVPCSTQYTVPCQTGMPLFCQPLVLSPPLLNSGYYSMAVTVTS